MVTPVGEKGHIPWNKGKRGCYSEEYRHKMSELRKGHIPWNKGKHGCYSDETRRRMGEANVGNTYNDGRIRSTETRKRISESKKGSSYPNYKRTVEGNRRIIESPNSAVFKKGNMPWNKGKPNCFSDESLQKLSKTLKERGVRPPEWARLQAVEIIKNTPRSEEHKHNLSMALKGHINSPEARAKMSKAHKGVPLSEAHKIALTTAVFKSCRERRPTKPEQLLGVIINEVCPNRYKYTGNGTVVIFNRNPDFTNINGSKAVILLHGIFWHLWLKQKKNPELTKADVERADKKFYKTYGWDCLIVWDDELKEPDKVRAKIAEFTGVGM